MNFKIIRRVLLLIMVIVLLPVSCSSKKDKKVLIEKVLIDLTPELFTGIQKAQTADTQESKFSVKYFVSDSILFEPQKSATEITIQKDGSVKVRDKTFRIYKSTPGTLLEIEELAGKTRLKVDFNGVVITFIEEREGFFINSNIYTDKSTDDIYLAKNFGRLQVIAE